MGESRNKETLEEEEAPYPQEVNSDQSTVIVWAGASSSLTHRIAYRYCVQYFAGQIRVLLLLGLHGLSFIIIVRIEVMAH